MQFCISFGLTHTYTHHKLTIRYEVVKWTQKKNRQKEKNLLDIFNRKNSFEIERKNISFSFEFTVGMFLLMLTDSESVSISHIDFIQAIFLYVSLRTSILPMKIIAHSNWMTRLQIHWKLLVVDCMKVSTRKKSRFEFNLWHSDTMAFFVLHRNGHRTYVYLCYAQFMLRYILPLINGISNLSASKSNLP